MPSNYLVASCPECKASVCLRELASNKSIGRGYRCNKCKAQQIRGWRTRNAETVIMWNLWSSAKRRARAKGLQFSITVEDVKAKRVQRCPLLGMPLDWTYGGKDRTRQCSPSLDRLDNSKGYTDENTWIISWRANTLKSNASSKELRMLAVNLARYEEHGAPAATQLGAAAVIRNYKRHSQDTVEAIVRMRKEGRTIRGIQAAIDVPRSTIAWILKKETSACESASA